ncbi:hypothetical protein QQZ08_002252 [Neonectria magnoliae]|uniref:Glycosyltransferase family 2 protein n=1 Tax=Neonectria magnoliae TaxID=2732573 RepID=A0ABR1IE24_9HYPO
MSSFPWYIPPAFIGLGILSFIRFFRAMTFYCAATIRVRVPILQNSLYSHGDCSVVVPVSDFELEADLDGSPLDHCIRSILKNNVFALFLVTVDVRRRDHLHNYISRLGLEYPSTQIHVGAVATANKRSQIAHALPHVSTAITILADDDVTWPADFVANAIAPFSLNRLGAVGITKKIRKEINPSTCQPFWSFLHSVYCEIQDTQVLNVNVLDRLRSGISSQTSLYRTEIIRDTAFLEAFQNEYSFFGRLGPIVDGYENFIVRWLVRNNWKILIQDGEPIEIPPVKPLQFIQQCVHQHRISMHFNAAMLCVPQIWNIKNAFTLFTKISDLLSSCLIFDTCLILALIVLVSWNNWAWACLALAALAVLANKLVKSDQVVSRHPPDGIHIPGFVLFEYFQDLLKVKAIFTLYKLQHRGCRPIDLEGGVEKIDWITGTIDEEMRNIPL